MWKMLGKMCFFTTFPIYTCKHPLIPNKYVYGNKISIIRNGKSEGSEKF